MFRKNKGCTIKPMPIDDDPRSFAWKLHNIGYSVNGVIVDCGFNTHSNLCGRESKACRKYCQLLAGHKASVGST